jgi:transmembrane sensor
MADQTPRPASPDDSADWEAIARYFAGESSPDERSVVRGWLDAHPDQAASLAALNDTTGRLPQASPAGLDVEAALRRVTERRDAEREVDGVTPLASRRPAARVLVPVAAPSRRWSRFVLPAAAAAVLIAGAGLVWHSARTGGYTQPVAVQARTFVTLVGERDSVRLADGTRVVLAPESQLIVSAGYGDDVREVELRGEAYFDVVHDEARPFLVRAGDAAIRDLGTTFTVRATGSAGGSAAGVRVAVTSGLVSLAPARAPGDAAVVLRPGDAGTLATDGRTLVERGGAAESDTAWTRGRLVFREAPIPVVRAELRRWYGIDLQVDSTFASRHLSMTFDGDSVDRVLQVIALSLGAEVGRQGDTAHITPVATRPR